jgi:hypothetical protein
MLIAEELEVDLGRAWEPAPPNQKLYGNPLLEAFRQPLERDTPVSCAFPSVILT